MEIQVSADFHAHSLHISSITKEFSVLILFFWLAIAVYLIAFVLNISNQRPWPWHRLLLWFVGNGAALTAIWGPVAEKAHSNFTLHMIGHLLLGMLAPLCIVMAAPRTLLLRTLPVKLARGWSRIMKLGYFRLIAHPLTASVLNMGGLWLLYATSLYEVMHQHPWLYVLVHLHVFLAGYLFTAAMIDIDPQPYRTSFSYRAGILICALAAHAILAKYIYAHPPPGVPVIQAQQGAMLMYYGGDLIDLVLIIIFCWQWYHKRRPRLQVLNPSPS